MKNMVNPVEGMISLQQAIDKNDVNLEVGRIHSDIYMHFDKPTGTPRLTYIKLSKKKKIISYCVFVLTDCLEGFNCFNIGYAVAPAYRGKKLSFEILQKSIDEIKNGFQNSMDALYLEAIVSIKNIASQKVANKLISPSPRKCIDAISGEDALSYTRFIKFK